MKRGKKYLSAIEAAGQERKATSFKDALTWVKKVAFAKFDESIDLAFKLNLKRSHVVRGVVVYPHNFQKAKRILVFAKGDKAKEAEEAGADFVGGEELVEKISDGWLDFDVAVATPDMMRFVGRLGMVLGRRGLMPNPKTQTVTNDLSRVVGELKRGRTEFKANKEFCIHVPVGKVSMSDEQILENIQALHREVLSKKPSDLKGEYIKSMALSSTMGPGFKIGAKEVV